VNGASAVIMTEWHEGSPPQPPVNEEGRLIAVVLRRDIESPEHYGDPAIVRQWASKMKTTVGANRVDYDDVARWAEVPEWMKG
jgi:hypothetical protein